jgi:membrane protein
MPATRRSANSIGSLFIQTASEWFRDNALRLSAAVSFYAVLSLAPLLAIVIRVTGIVHASQFAREQILRQIANLMGTHAADAIKPILENTAASSRGYLATTISTAILLFSTTSVFIELQDSMNTIWGVKFKPHKTRPADRAVHSFIHSRLVSLTMVFCLGFLLVFSMLLSGVFTAMKQYISGVDPWPVYLLHLAISCAVEFILFAAIFKFLPALRLGWRNVWHGALIAAILFSAGRFGLSLYFKYSHIDNAYGAAGSLIAILTWIYYSSFSLFFGAEFTKVWTRRYDPSRVT